MKTLYWLSLALLFWVFFGYPILMILLSRFRQRRFPPHLGQSDLLSVTLLVCAYNEEKVIGEKIQNSLALGYPADKLKLVVVSDGSSDHTDQIARSFSDPRLSFHTYPDRGGKAKALNLGLEHLSGEIIILTDANVIFERDALRKLVAAFADPHVGAAVGNVVLRSPDGSIAGEGIYSRYEKAVHTAEAILATMITVDGAMYAIRREYARPIPPDSITDDWFLATGALLARQRIAWVPDAIGYENAAESVAGEFKRKVRMAAGGYQTMFRRAGLFLNPLSHPVVSFMFVGHKLLRWLAMVFMLTLLLANIVLVKTSVWYMTTVVLQGIFYLLAWVGWVLSSHSDAVVVYIPYYFTAVNWGALLGLWKYLTGGQTAVWTKSR